MWIKCCQRLTIMTTGSLLAGMETERAIIEVGSSGHQVQGLTQVARITCFFPAYQAAGLLCSNPH